MMARWLLVLAVGVLDSGGDGSVNVGEAKWDFSAPSRYELVRDWKEDTEVSKASVIFNRLGRVKIHWQGTTAQGSCEWKSNYEYRLDHHSGLPIISEPSYFDLLGLAGPFLWMTGNHLELTIRQCHPTDIRIHELPGPLHLILKRAP
jgi:hypothetical protein